jgi:hypothetical protein
MRDRAHLTTWVSGDFKARFAELAKRHGLSESAMLRRVVESTLLAALGPSMSLPEPVEPVAASGRISVRLRDGDLVLLRERARGRQMPTSTYVSLLVRSHLRAVTPLPTAEFEALRRSVLEVAAIGRNLNQIARAVNEGQWPHGPNRNDLVAMIRALTVLKNNFKAALNANLSSWDAGYGKKD